MTTTSGQKNLYEDDSVVSPAVDKDAVLVDDEEREVIDQPSKGLPSIPIIISGSTHTETFDPHPTEGTLLQTNVDDDDDDADVNFGDLSAFDEILSASFTVPNKEILAASGSEVQKSLG